MKQRLSYADAIKTLPVEQRKNGFDYTLVLRGERSCIFEQTVSDSVKYYEVFLIRVKPESNINGKVIPAHEWFPNDEAFGRWAWSFRTLQKAKKRFYDLEKKSKFNLPKR